MMSNNGIHHLPDVNDADYNDDDVDNDDNDYAVVQ